MRDPARPWRSNVADFGRRFTRRGFGFLSAVVRGVRPSFGVAIVLGLLVSDRSPAAGSPQVPYVEAKDWYKLVTPNFELYGNGRSQEARQLLRELETYRHVASRFLGLTNVQRQPAMVFFFRDAGSFKPFQPLYQGKPRSVSGYHADDPLDYALALSYQAKGSENMHVLFHEYTHMLTARQFRNAPPWLHEGVAEVFSTFQSLGDDFDIGIALTNHVRFLQANRPSPVRDLLRVTFESADYNEERRAGHFYATSWVLAHYLLFARRGFETNVMARYADLCASTTNQIAAFESAFGKSPDDLDGPLRRYLGGGEYTIVRQTYPDLETARPREESLTPGEIEFALGRLLQIAQRPEEGLALIQRAALAAPRDPRPFAALALAAWREEQTAELAKNSDAALERGSKHPFLLFLAAHSRYLLANDKARPIAVRAQALASGRDLCLQAVALDPGLAQAHHLLGVYELRLNPKDASLAASHVQDALRCDPHYKPAQLTWASLLAAQGQFSEARSVIDELLASPLPDDLRATATNIRAEIQKRLLAPTPPATSSRRN